MNELKNIKKSTKILGVIKKTGIYFGLSLWALAVLFPFYWRLLTSVKSYSSFSSSFSIALARDSRVRKAPGRSFIAIAHSSAVSPSM